MKNARQEEERWNRLQEEKADRTWLAPLYFNSESRLVSQRGRQICWTHLEIFVEIDRALPKADAFSLLLSHQAYQTTMATKQLRRTVDVMPAMSRLVELSSQPCNALSTEASVHTWLARHGV